MVMVLLFVLISIHMKKFTLFLLAVFLVTATSMALQPAKTLSKERVAGLSLKKTTETKATLSKASKQRLLKADRLRAAREVFAKQKASQKSNGANKAKQIAKDMIVDQPAGTLVNYARGGFAYYVMFNIYSTNFSGAMGDVVFGEGNEVYIKNIISQYATGAWVKGTIDGANIKIQFPQQVLDYDGTPYYAMMLGYDAGEQWFLPIEDQTLTLNYDATTGAITTDPNSDFGLGNTVVALCEATGDWTGYADWNMSFTKVTDTPVVAPEGLETSSYALSAEGYEGSIAEVGFSGNDIYVKGLYKDLPDAWVKGTIDGDKVYFKSGQYFGADEELGYHVYLLSAIAEEAYDDYYEEYYTEYTLSNDDIVFDFDPANKTLTNSSAFLINAGKDVVYYVNGFNKASLTPFVEVPATPATPVFTDLYEAGYTYYLYGYGWGYFSFDLPTADTEGNYIVPEKLFYKLYYKVNGEVKPYVLTCDIYTEIDELEMTEIPVNYSENWDIYRDGVNTTIYYHVIGPEAFGVQAVYYGGGEEHSSDIAWINVEEIGAEIQPEAATPAYPEVDPTNVGGSIDFGYYTGEQDLSSFGDQLTETYNVAIKLQDPALEGTHIDAITFPLMNTENMSNVSVFLTSQLRVEDGKNVPDLIKIDVPSPEAGFVTVNLEKPYVIPAGGVYVGYSFDIDEVSDELNQYPIAVMEGVNDGGFCIQTSRCFLKWMDISEMSGATAAIQVTVSGKTVADNAAATAAGEKLYVKTGEPFEAVIPIINHGAKGVQSVDLEYAIAGQTGSKHIDLTEPINGFFGLSSDIALPLSAIAEDGNYELTVKVVKVNGEVNNDAAAQAITEVVSLSTVPKKRTLIEEYTGTWCGYCPRGMVALEHLAKAHPDDFVAISYHNGDPMEILPSSNFPSSIQGYPSAWIDRVEEVDPYYGTGSEALYIVKDLQRRNKVFGQGNIEITTELSSDKKSVDIFTEVTFPYNISDNKFALEYVLVADGLTGAAGTEWDQTNYYSGGSLGEMSGFEAAESTIQGMTFNDVAIAMSRIGGIPGSLPIEIKGGEAIKHSFYFDFADVANTKFEPIIQDVNKLRVVVLLVDTTTGEVVNANKVNVGDATGIGTIAGNQADNSIIEVSYYDISGRRINTPQRGLNIMSVKYADGTQKSVKLFR